MHEPEVFPPTEIDVCVLLECVDGAEVTSNVRDDCPACPAVNSIAITNQFYLFIMRRHKKLFIVLFSGLREGLAAGRLL